MSSPHSENLAGFRDWAHANGGPKHTWEITREEAHALFEQLETYERALEDIATDSAIPHAAPQHLGWLARRALAGSNPASRSSE